MNIGSRGLGVGIVTLQFSPNCVLQFSSRTQDACCDHACLEAVRQSDSGLRVCPVALRYNSRRFFAGSLVVNRHSIKQGREYTCNELHINTRHKDTENSVQNHIQLQCSEDTCRKVYMSLFGRFVPKEKLLCAVLYNNFF